MLKVFSSLRARVLLLIAIAFAVMLGMTIYHALGGREDRLTNARSSVLDTARVMAGEQRQIIERVHRVLASAALLPEVRRTAASKACDRALAAQVQQEPSLANMSLALANGDVICNATRTARRIGIADLDHFKAAIQTRGFSAGGYLISRSTGVPGMGFAYPVLDETRVPRAVIVATLSLAWLKQELAKAQLPEGARVTVVDGDGLVLARHPDPERWDGKRAPELPLWRSILAKGGEGTEEGINLDGVRQIFGFVPLHRTAASRQAYLWVAIPKDVVVSPPERPFVVGLLVAVALTAPMFGVVWLGSESLFVRRIAALRGAGKELSKGNLATRVGFKSNGDENGQLAQSIDRMAEGLQTKEAQLSRTVRTLRVLSAGNHTMLRAKQGEQHLLEQMCRAIVEAGGYRAAWAGYAVTDIARSIRPVAHWGSVPEGYFELAKFTWNATESGQTPLGNAIRTGAPAVAPDIQSEAVPQSWRDDALRCGFGSYVALPLHIDEHVIGVLVIYAEETDAFNDEEVRLLSEAAADLSFWIAGQRAEVEQARMKESEERLRPRRRGCSHVAATCSCRISRHA